MTVQRTRSQKRILNLLQLLNRGLSAQDIYVELRSQNQGMGLATVYRALEALKKRERFRCGCYQMGSLSTVRYNKTNTTWLACSADYRFQLTNAPFMS